jgi:hypothetical protein
MEKEVDIRHVINQFTLEAGRAALANSQITAEICISHQNENVESYASLESALFPIDTFSTNIGAATNAWRIPVIRRRLAAPVRANRVSVVIDLMPHVWSAFVLPAVRAAGQGRATSQLLMTRMLIPAIGSPR